MSYRRRKRVTFRATTTVNRRVGVSFRTESGKRVSFVAKKRVPKRKTVTFYARRTR